MFPPVRPISRRTQPKQYVLERLELPKEPDATDPAIQAASALVETGSLVSALRPQLKAAGIDPRFMPLVMTFAVSRSSSQRTSDIAWRLGITTGAASHLLDRAEQRGLVQKRYEPFDRRGTWVMLTSKGRAYQVHVMALIRGGIDTKRNRGKAFGIRAALGHDPKPKY